MEAVLERPRVSTRGNIFERAKRFFTNIFNRRKTRSRVAVNSKVVENTNARVIPVEDTMSLLSSIYPLESLVEMYEQRVSDTNKKIEELRTDMINNPENQEVIQKEYYELVKNLKVDSYILETKKNELAKMQAETQKEVEKSEEVAKEEAKEAEKNNNNYTELYNRIKYLIEEKVRLSNARINRINNINSYIKNINSNTNDFQGKLMYLVHLNEAFNANAKEETLIDNQLNVFIKEMYSIDPNFSLNQEFGDLIKQIAVPTENFIRTNVTTIIEKQYFLEQEMSNTAQATQEVLKDILKELDTALSNLNYNLNNPNMLSIIINEVNEQISAKYSKEEPKNEVEEPDEFNLQTYREQLDKIKDTIEEKTRLTNTRIDLLNSLEEYLANIDSNTNDFQDKLFNIALINEKYKVNMNEDIEADNSLKAYRTNARFLNREFDFDKEFGNLVEKIPVPSEEYIRNIVTVIIEKQYFLEQEISRVDAPAQEYIKDILNELDTVLSNLSYKFIYESDLKPIISEVNAQISAKYQKVEEKTQTEQVVEDKKDDTEKQQAAPKETKTSTKDAAKPIIDPKKSEKKERDKKNKYLNELNQKYKKINELNDLFSTAYHMTYQATIYFAKILDKVDKRINTIKANLNAMPYVSPDEIKDQEVFPDNLQNFISLHKEKIVRANNELISLESLATRDEATLQHIDTLQKYLAVERKLIERRLVFEKRRDNSINVFDYLSQINGGASLPKEEPVQEQPTATELTQARIERTKIYVAKPQRITQIKALIETLHLYKVEHLKRSIKIKINQHARQQLKNLLGEIKVVINNNNGLNGVKLTATENKKGYEVQEISNLGKLDDLKVVVSTNGEEVESEEIVSQGRSL